MRRRNPQPGFTLLELLVAVGIVTVLLALLLPAVQKVRAAAARVKCTNNLKQIGVALHGYHDVSGRFPPGLHNDLGPSPQPFMSWNTRLLPFLEGTSMWAKAEESFARNRNFLRNPPHTLLGHPLPAFSCPADSRTLQPKVFAPAFRVAFTAYLGVEGMDQFTKDGVLYLDSQVRVIDITDGASNTLAVGERPPSADGDFGWWYAGWGQSKDGSCEMVLGAMERNVAIKPGECPAGAYSFGPGNVNNQCDALHFWSLHGGGAHFLFADGSTRFLRYEAASVLPSLATRSGGETTDSLP